jgi:ABC-2 type transport system ATP-binding protein
LKSLSQGEKKKISILLALLNNPDILIMDEPFANIDPIYISTLMKYIFTDKRTVIYSTNDWGIIKNKETKILMISNGMQMDYLMPIVELQKAIPSVKKVVVEYIEEMLPEINMYPHYIKDNHTHIFVENPSIIMNRILTYSNNISILPTDIIDYYILNQSKTK